MVKKIKKSYPDWWAEACIELSQKDEVMKKLIKFYSDSSISTIKNPFYSLSRCIVGQQISVQAADAVWGRFSALVGEISPELILKPTPEALKNCGLSARKVEYIRGISETWTKEYAEIDWEILSDDEVKRKLIALRGVGPWTAEMILMFSLLRPDIFPIDDIGAIRAIENIYNGGEVMSKEDLLDQAENWAPWRTVATWFLWRTIDDEPVEY